MLVTIIFFACAGSALQITAVPYQEVGLTVRGSSRVEDPKQAARDPRLPNLHYLDQAPIFYAGLSASTSHEQERETRPVTTEG